MMRQILNTFVADIQERNGIKMKLKKLLKHHAKGLQIVKIYRSDNDTTKKVYNDRAYGLVCRNDLLESKVVSWCVDHSTLKIYIK